MRYSKKCVKNKRVCFNKIMFLIIMKMRLKMKIGSYRYDINLSNTETELKKALIIKKLVVDQAIVLLQFENDGSLLLFLNQWERL